MAGKPPFRRPSLSSSSGKGLSPNSALTNSYDIPARTLDSYMVTRYWFWWCDSSTFFLGPACTFIKILAIQVLKLSEGHNSITFSRGRQRLQNVKVSRRFGKSVRVCCWLGSTKTDDSDGENFVEYWSQMIKPGSV